MVNKSNSIFKDLEKTKKLLDCLYENFSENADIFIKNYKDDQSIWNMFNYMNKNNGKYALKRKITTLRQELLNISKKLDEIH